MLLTIAVAIAGSQMFVSSIASAHEGHAHTVLAQRARDSQDYDRQAREFKAALASERYERSLQAYAVPDVAMVNADARPVRVRELLAADGPVVLDFISTRCSAVCQSLSSALSMVPKKLGAAAAKLRMVSVSIDPDNDTPAQLKAYARRFAAGANWQFLTGAREDIETMQRAFDAYDDDKREVKPLTFLRAAPGKPWMRINGLASGEDLAREFGALASN